MRFLQQCVVDWRYFHAGGDGRLACLCASPSKYAFGSTGSVHPSACYSSAFDELALRVLRDLRERKFGGEDRDLAYEMLQEVLCGLDLCEYGGRMPTPGDLLFSRNATVGEVSQVSDLHPAFAMGQDVCLLRRLQKNYSPDFMQFYFSSQLAKEQLDLLMVGATFKRVNVEEIRNMIVPCPSAEEQGEICRVISKVDASFATLTSTAQSAITLLQERRAALISAAVTGKIDVRALAPQESEAA